MARKETDWQRRFRRAEERAKLNKAAVEAIRGIARDEMMTWSAAAVLLNERGVRNHLGRVWNGTMLLAFVRTHLAYSGEELMPWMRGVGSRMEGKKYDQARARFIAIKRQAQDERGASDIAHLQKKRRPMQRLLP